MNQELLAYTYSFSAVITFSVASIGFTYFSKKVSPLWMNVFKSVVAFAAALIFMLFLGKVVFEPIGKVWPFVVSGFIGLNLGDFFILSAYKRIGPGRTLILFGFEPFFVGSFSYIFWGEQIHSIQFVAIIFFVMCLFLFGLEQFKKSGTWEVRGLCYALLGVILDSVGVLLTRYNYNIYPDFGGLEALFFRTGGALLSFILLIPFVRMELVSQFKKLTFNEKWLAIISSFLGTFLTLVLYLQAIRVGKLATVTSIVLVDPMMSTFFECVWLKLWPTRYLWMAIGCFVCAMFCLMYPQWSQGF